MAKYLTKETLKYMDYGAYIGNKSGPAGGKTMTDLRKAIQAVKEGSLSTMRIMGRPQQRMTPSERMARYHVPGFRFAPIHHDEIAWAGGYGVLEADGDEPVTSETRFQTASINKSVSAMAVLHLVQEGTLDLETTPFPPSRRCHRARPVALAGEGLRSLQNVAVSAPAIDSDSPTISLLGKAD